MTPWTVALQAPLSMGFFRQEHWSGLPFLSPGNLPNPGTESGSPTLQADSLLSEPSGKLKKSNPKMVSRWSSSPHCPQVGLGGQYHFSLWGSQPPTCPSSRKERMLSTQLFSCPLSLHVAWGGPAGKGMNWPQKRRSKLGVLPTGNWGEQDTSKGRKRTTREPGVHYSL